MTKPVLFFMGFMLLAQTVYPQLNCKTTVNAKGGTEKKCHHKNGKLSTLETWDKEKRSGSMKAYDANGKELFTYDLRSFAGHASVYLTYFQNGQVKKAEYSSAPDGGIQFYHKIHEFDEYGKQTSFMDLSRPDGYDRLPTIPDSLQVKKPKKTIDKKEAVQIPKDKQQLTVLKIRNDSGKKMSVLLKKQINSYLLRKDSLVYLEPKQLLTIDSIAKPAEFINSCDLHEPELPMPKAKKAKYEIILEIPRETEKKRTYLWHVIKS